MRFIQSGGIREQDEMAIAALRDAAGSPGRLVGEGPDYRRKEEPKTGYQEERKGHKTIKQGSRRDK